MCLFHIPPLCSACQHQLQKSFGRERLKAQFSPPAPLVHKVCENACKKKLAVWWLQIQGQDIWKETGENDSLPSKIISAISVQNTLLVYASEWFVLPASWDLCHVAFLVNLANAENKLKSKARFKHTKISSYLHFEFNFKHTVYKQVHYICRACEAGHLSTK